MQQWSCPSARFRRFTLAASESYAPESDDGRSEATMRCLRLYYDCLMRTTELMYGKPRPLQHCTDYLVPAKTERGHDLCEATTEYVRLERNASWSAAFALRKFETTQFNTTRYPTLASVRLL